MKGLYEAFTDMMTNLPKNVVPVGFDDWLRVMNATVRGKGRDRSKTKKGAFHRGDIIGFRDNGSAVRRLENPAGTKMARKAAQGRCGL